MLRQGGMIMSRHMTQLERLLKWLQDFGSITPAEAYEELGIMRLAARIKDLRDAGYPIIVVMESKKNRYGVTVSYARYSMGVSLSA